MELKYELITVLHSLTNNNAPDGLAVSGRPAPGTNVLDFFAISFCNSLPFLLLKSAIASSLSCDIKQNKLMCAGNTESLAC